MKFQIGSKVEVLSRKKTPSGAWRLAEVVSDNGDDYTVRYERYFGISKGTTERVKKDIVRPCPPLVKGVADWTVGDIVEVLDDSYWKVAVIESVEGEGFYVRVLGSFDEFKVQRGSIRVRQAWEDNKWVVLDKDSNVCEDLISKAQRTLKRAFADSDGHLDTYYGNCQKSRAVEADGQCGGKVLVCSSSNTTKVDGAVYMQGSWNQNNCHSSHIDSNIAANGDIFVEQNPDVFLDRILEQNDSDSIVSSVGSCSAIECSTNKLHIDSLAIGFNNLDTLSSDAESYYRTPHEERRHEPFQEKSYVPRTHRSELHTYRGTLEALYASGPLSWELETYLTDLRAMLHISSDEHLAEVRKLKSFSTVEPWFRQNSEARQQGPFGGGLFCYLVGAMD